MSQTPEALLGPTLMQSPLRRSLLLLLAVLVLAIAAPSGADGAQVVPDSVLTLRVAARDNLTFTVEVANPSDRPAIFESVGLYFLPGGKDEAPQRLGVLAAGQVAQGSGWQNAGEVVTVAPHQTLKMQLNSYCLDEHRKGPTPGTTYYLATQRIPTSLKSALQEAARTKGQSGVWQVRAARPTALLGDQP